VAGAWQCRGASVTFAEFLPQSRDLVGDLFALTIDTFDYQF
jgi:hypothetical protein